MGSLTGWDRALFPLLWMMEKVYDVQVERRKRQALTRTRRFPMLVVSVGNLTVGGTGKTLLTQHLTGMLEKEFGKAVGVVLRGYRGKLRREEAEMVRAPDVEKYGDEAVLLWEKGIPVWVARVREKALEEMMMAGLEVAILDDGFQYWSIIRDVDLVCWDTSQPFWLHRLPLGPCREKWSELRRATCIILMRTNLAGPMPLSYQIHRFQKNFPQIPLFEAEIHPKEIPGKPGERLLAVSGIAYPENFESLLDLCGFIVLPYRFPDHHSYSRSDVSQILRYAEQKKVDGIVTTEKDYLKIRKYTESILPLPIEVKFRTPEQWKHFWHLWLLR